MLDINLNGNKGHDVADALAARGVPFVFSTGYSALDMRDGYRDRPVLKKPFPYEGGAGGVAENGDFRQGESVLPLGHLRRGINLSVTGNRGTLPKVIPEGRPPDPALNGALEQLVYVVGFSRG